MRQTTQQFQLDTKVPPSLMRRYSTSLHSSMSYVVLDPSSFEPVVSFMTRYGYVELSNTASSLGNAADYLGTVTVANVTFQDTAILKYEIGPRSPPFL